MYRMQRRRCPNRGAPLVAGTQGPAGRRRRDLAARPRPCWPRSVTSGTRWDFRVSLLGDSVHTHVMHSGALCGVSGPQLASNVPALAGCRSPPPATLLALYLPFTCRCLHHCPRARMLVAALLVLQHGRDRPAARSFPGCRRWQARRRRQSGTCRGRTSQAMPSCRCATDPLASEMHDTS